MKKGKLKKIIMLNLPYAIVLYLSNKAVDGYYKTRSADFFEQLSGALKSLAMVSQKPFPSFDSRVIVVSLLFTAAFYGFLYYKRKTRKKFRDGIEHGSARFGGEKDIEPYIDPVFENNAILSETECLMMNSRPAKAKYGRNKNIMVVGGSGTGKTFYFVKPNLMQMHSSYVVTDPKGDLIIDCGKMFQRGRPKQRIKTDKKGKFVKNLKGEFVYEPVLNKKGKQVYEPYKIKVLNTIDFEQSMKYNPFAYINSTKDIISFVNAIIANTKGEGEKSAEDFWVKAERLYYMALVGYIYYVLPEDRRNFRVLLEMINASETKEEDENFKNAIDIMFEELEQEQPTNFAVKQYKKYKLAAGKTAKAMFKKNPATSKPPNNYIIGYFDGKSKNNF
ncbi:hypothetical protein AGMMS49975_17690 [Clostridia bacterium]|nr:hypothetical protein AGMMS49975_17690 [Clostridia bacterium]